MAGSIERRHAIRRISDEGDTHLLELLLEIKSQLAVVDEKLGQLPGIKATADHALDIAKTAHDKHDAAARWQSEHIESEARKAESIRAVIERLEGLADKFDFIGRVRKLTFRILFGLLAGFAAFAGAVETYEKLIPHVLKNWPWPPR